MGCTSLTPALERQRQGNQGLPRLCETLSENKTESTYSWRLSYRSLNKWP